jgi:formylaminopyrimidine deformylase / aminopyrimidine aminohydrolase
MSYQATLLTKAPRDAHNALVAGLAALDSELAWFEGHASRLQVDLAVTPHPVCRRYADTWTSCSRPSTGTHIQCCRLS